MDAIAPISPLLEVVCFGLFEDCIIEIEIEPFPLFDADLSIEGIEVEGNITSTNSTPSAHDDPIKMPIKSEGVKPTNALLSFRPDSTSCNVEIKSLLLVITNEYKEYPKLRKHQGSVTEASVQYRRDESGLIGGLMSSIYLIHQLNLRNQILLKVDLKYIRMVVIKIENELAIDNAAKSIVCYRRLMSIYQRLVTILRLLMMPKKDCKEFRDLHFISCQLSTALQIEKH